MSQGLSPQESTRQPVPNPPPPASPSRLRHRKSGGVRERQAGSDHRHLQSSLSAVVATATGTLDLTGLSGPTADSAAATIIPGEAAILVAVLGVIFFRILRWDLGSLRMGRIRL